MIFDLFLSSSTQSSSVGREKESLSNATTITTTTRTPPSIGFASSENLFSYVRLPVSKSVERAFCVSEMCRAREHKRERSNPTSISFARAYTATIEKKSPPFYLSRLSRCLGSTSPWCWWCLFLCVRPFFRFSVRKERAFRCQLLQRKRLDSRER